MEIKKISTIKKRYKPLCRIKSDVVTYHLGALYIINEITGRKQKVCTLPMSITKRIFGFSRIFERIFRLEPRTAIESAVNEVLVSHLGAIYRINLYTKKVIREHRYREEMNNPLALAKIQGIDGFDDCIAYGEYFNNENKGSVAIYARKTLETNWEKVFEFAANTINHIHAIIPDPYRNGVLILTGDDDESSGIWIAKNGFKQVEPLLIGEQKYRSCCAFPLPDGILYATDTPLEQNFIGFIKETSIGWEEERVTDLNGSCIYASHLGDNYVFSTTVEPDSRFNGIKYLLSYRLGQGIKNWNSELIAGNIEGGFHKIAQFKKDLFPMALCQFGNVIFCNGNNENEIFAYPIALRSYDAKIIKIIRKLA